MYWYTNLSKNALLQLKHTETLIELEYKIGFRNVGELRMNSVVLGGMWREKKNVHKWILNFTSFNVEMCIFLYSIF